MAAVAFAREIDTPLNAHATIHWAGTSIGDDPDGSLFRKVREGLDKWLIRQGIAGGLTAIHTPGHCAGHLAFFWPQEGVLFAGDTCGNLPRLGMSVAYEDLEVGKQSLSKLAKLDFAVACFGHGKAIQRDASALFRKHWG